MKNIVECKLPEMYQLLVYLIFINYTDITSTMYVCGYVSKTMSEKSEFETALLANLSAQTNILQLMMKQAPKSQYGVWNSEDVSHQPANVMVFECRYLI